MKNIYRYLLIFTASALVVSCGESDLEPTLALDKDLDAINEGKKIKDKRFEIHHCAFSEMDKILKKKILKNWMVF